MGPIETYLARSQELIEVVRAQRDELEEAADWFAATIARGRMVHVFGSGHSRILVEEMWPRYGSFPGFNPIVELSLTFHNLVVGANGQRQAMHLENVSGLAERILRNFDITPEDSALVISSSGCNTVPVEMAELFQAKGLKVVSIVSKAHAQKSESNLSSGLKLEDVSDLVLDTGAPAGDAMVEIPGLDALVGPGSTVGGVLIINCIKAAVAQRLTEGGAAPTVLTAPAVVGAKRSSDLFEAAFDEHARRLARLFSGLGLGEASTKLEETP